MRTRDFDAEIEVLKLEIKQKQERIRHIKKQKSCDHNWTYRPYEEGDSFCFQRERGETIICSKCGYEIERGTHPQSTRLPDEIEDIFRKVRRVI